MQRAGAARTGEASRYLQAGTKRVVAKLRRLATGGSSAADHLQELRREPGTCALVFVLEEHVELLPVRFGQAPSPILEQVSLVRLAAQARVAPGSGRPKRRILAF